MKEGGRVKLNRTKIEIAMASACINSMELCEKAEMNYMTFRSASHGNECKPATAGKIARALNVTVSDLLEK